MEHYDQRRRQGGGEDSRRHPQNEERGRDRESWRPDDEHSRRRAGGEERGWLDYDRNQDRPNQRYSDQRRDDQRYGRDGSERQSFSPDWSREGAEPRNSDEPYYSRNRERGGSGDQSRFSEYSNSQSRGWRPEDRSQWEQRSRESIPHEQRELTERSGSGDYYSPDWPYEQGDRGREQRHGEGRYMQRGSEDEQGSHYRGSYSRSSAPFAYPGGRGYMYSESITLHGPYSGRGPKGYKRSDQQIIEEASQRLERDGHIDASEIEVTAEDGLITLRGTVPDRRTKRRAEECVESVYGARDVMNELRCSQESSQQGSPQESQGSQSSQGSRRSQSSTRGSQSSSPTSRGTTTGSGSEQPEDKRSPKH
ncbi:MAG TPA: BON domain-containing protein [Gammaproteobacteria bacterium]|nr:BON domain-containing protein [Gammaproteobacteria bacterium]